MDFGEDMYLDLKWRDEGRNLAHVPGADVGFRPRSTLAGFFRQYFNYARGDGKAGMWRLRHLIRYSSYLAGAWSIALALNFRPAVLVTMFAGLVYLRRPYQRLLMWSPAMSPRQIWAALFLVPVIRVVGDLAKMTGFLVGLGEALGKRFLPR